MERIVIGPPCRGREEINALKNARLWNQPIGSVSHSILREHTMFRTCEKMLILNWWTMQNCGVENLQMAQEYPEEQNWQFSSMNPQKPCTQWKKNLVWKKLLRSVGSTNTDSPWLFISGLILVLECKWAFKLENVHLFLTIMLQTRNKVNQACLLWNIHV